MVHCDIYKDKKYESIEVYHEQVTGHTNIRPDKVLNVEATQMGESTEIHIEDESSDVYFYAENVRLLVCNKKCKITYGDD